jgi:hypothetical protein
MNDQDNTREHQQVWESLPWLVNGSASPEQRLRATAHLADCADCRHEFEAQQRLQQALAGQADGTRVDMEAGLAQLLGRLDLPAEEQPLPREDRRPAPRREMSRLTMALALAVVVQAVGLGAIGLQRAGDGQTARYRTLSESPAATAVHAQLRVIPDAAMSMASWQRLLQAHGLHVVEGPNAVGAYGLALSEPAAPQPALDAVLAQLRSEPGVRFAEPAGPMR